MTKDWRQQRLDRARQTAHRKVPMPTVPPGVCRWCERTILGKRGKYIGKPDPNRSWCRQATEGRNCWHEFCRHTDCHSQAWFLKERVGDHCAECGKAAPPQWFKDGPTCHVLDWSHGTNDVDFLRCLWKREDAPDFRDLGLQQPVTQRCLLEVDHVVPLWKVALQWTGNETLAERRRWFGPDNLQLLCGQHHKAKSKREAAERAALKRS